MGIRPASRLYKGCRKEEDRRGDYQKADVHDLTRLPSKEPQMAADKEATSLSSVTSSILL